MDPALLKCPESHSYGSVAILGRQTNHIHATTTVHIHATITVLIRFHTLGLSVVSWNKNRASRATFCDSQWIQHDSQSVHYFWRRCCASASKHGKTWSKCACVNMCAHACIHIKGDVLQGQSDWKYLRFTRVFWELFDTTTLIIIINIKDWTRWSIPSPGLQLLSPTFLRSSNWSSSLWPVVVWF
jgi:hypothetical protein